MPNRLTIPIISLIALFSLIPLPTLAQSNRYEPPSAFLNACLIATVPVSTIQIITEGSRVPIDGIIDKAFGYYRLFEFLKGDLLTPQKCRALLPDTQAEYDQYHFNRDLRRCDEYRLEDQERWIRGEAGYEGLWFCNTEDIEDWRTFRDFIVAEGNSPISEEWAEISDASTFEPPPDFSLDEILSANSEAFDLCQINAESGGAAAARLCVIEETLRHDNLLNTSYNCLRDTLSQEDFEPFQNAQRQWIAETEAACAYEDQGGTIVHDLRAGCRLGATREASTRIRRAALEAGCQFTDINTVEYDQNQWRNLDGNPSVTNDDGVRVSVGCQDNGRLNVRDLSDMDNPPFIHDTTTNVSLIYYDRSGDVLGQTSREWATVGVRSTINIQEEDIELLKQASRVGIDHDPFYAEVPLRGSSRALEGCDIAGRQFPQEPTPAAVTSLYQPSQNAFFITLPGDVPVRIRCDRPFPEAYLESSGVIGRLFGRSGASLGESWSFETLSRNGNTLARLPVTAATLDEGVGFYLNPYFLRSASISPTLVISGAGKEYQTAISAEANNLLACFNRSAQELERFLVGKWRNKFGAETLVFTRNAVSSRAGFMTVPLGYQMIFTNAAGREYPNNFWEIQRDGNISTAQTRYCGIEGNGQEFRFTEGWTCTFQTTWVRVE